MQTNLADFIKHSADGERAAAILQACVHCGFCSATCPTYQVLGDERDSPRGRIYLIKQVLEGQLATSRTQLHLDRCLTCRSCETTCPSGVQYGQLLDIGRKVVDAQVPRDWRERWLRQLMGQVLPRRKLVGPLLQLGQWLHLFLPDRLREKLTKPRRAGRLPAWSKPLAKPLAKSLTHSPTSALADAPLRHMILHEGCVQPGMAPNINAATIRVFDALGVRLLRVQAAGCCGALRWHLDQQAAALQDAKRNIDAWWPWIEAAEPVEAIVSNASGCGVMLKDYGHLLAHDPAYAAKAARVAALVGDVSELLLPLLRQPELASQIAAKVASRRTVAGALPQRLAYHPPCTLQHGQRVKGQVESVLSTLGFEVCLPQNAHLCCGSAGTYSVLQPALATTLRDNKLAALREAALSNVALSDSTLSDAVLNEKGNAAPGKADSLDASLTIVSGNIGCLSHLQSGSPARVCHWIEVVDDALNG